MSSPLITIHGDDYLDGGVGDGDDNLEGGGRDDKLFGGTGDVTQVIDYCHAANADNVRRAA